MRDRDPGQVDEARALVVELAGASPLPPLFPEAADESSERPRMRGTPRGVAVAASTFALIVSLAGGALWFANAGRQPGLGTSVAAPRVEFVATAATEAAVVAEDDTVLRGQLWRGDNVGIIVAPGYSDDATDSRQVAASLARSGHTVFFYNLRGQQSSGGRIGTDELVGDMRAAVADLTTRGIDRVFVIGYRQAATAAVVLAAEPSGLEGVVAVFPYETYEGLDAVTAAAGSTAPLLFIGAEGAGGAATATANLADSNGKTDPYILSARPPAALSSDHFSPKVVRAVLQFVDG
jgi:dienelactone hydrolase